MNDPQTPPDDHLKVRQGADPAAADETQPPVEEGTTGPEEKPNPDTQPPSGS